jgi:hypothetical protein
MGPPFGAVIRTTSSLSRVASPGTIGFSMILLCKSATVPTRYLELLLDLLVEPAKATKNQP